MHRKSPDFSGKWGIMGGIFDPIHNGHLLLAESASNACGLTGVLFVVSFDPPHRDHKPVASFETRLQMVETAIEDNDGFTVSDMEKDLKVPAYSVNIIEELKKQHPNADWHLILGADNIALFDTWYRPEKLTALVKIVVAQRPGYEQSGRESPWYKKVEKFNMPLIDISSTMIRHRLGEGRTIRYLVPENVRKIIIEKRLYR